VDRILKEHVFVPLGKYADAGISSIVEGSTEALPLRRREHGIRATSDTLSVLALGQAKVPIFDCAKEI
jgi:hypothetical protein